MIIACIARIEALPILRIVAQTIFQNPRGEKEAAASFSPLGFWNMVWATILRIGKASILAMQAMIKA